MASRPGGALTALILRRVATAIPLLFGIATLIYFLVELAPGEPGQRHLAPGMTSETIEQLRINRGLDQPMHVRYVRWLGGLAKGDLGVSFSENRPVADVIRDYLPATLLLSGCALFLAFLLGIVVGALQAVRQYSLFDSAASVVLLFFYSMPSFWLALMLILVGSLYARNVWELPIYFPPSGMTDIDHDGFSTIGRIADRARHLVLPTLSLSLVLAAGIARYMRGSMLEVIRQDLVRTARAKGLPERVVVFRHALRNALLPVITLIGLYLPFLFSGAVFVETIFSWPGMGRAIVTAVLARDYPVVVGISFFFAAIVVVANLVADVLYAVVDPRIRYE